jgi:hypothetical protein
MQVRLQGLDQLMLLTQHQVQRRDVGLIGGGVIYGNILSNTLTRESARRDYLFDHGGGAYNTNGGNRRMRVKSTPSSKSASSCSVS